jgi:glycosyltransferase involved in cell wall biosynthesis
MLWASPDTLGFAELRHLDNAILVDPSDPTAIAALLRKLDEDRDLLNRIGRNGRRTAMESFTWSAVAASMEQIYESVTTRAR